MFTTRFIFATAICLLLILPDVWAQEEALCPTEEFPNLEEQFISANLTLKILLVECQDVSHRTSPSEYLVSDFENMLVSFGTYVSPISYTPDDDEVYGSLHDYFNKMSSGNVILDGYVVNRQRFGIPQ